MKKSFWQFELSRRVTLSEAKGLSREAEMLRFAQRDRTGSLSEEELSSSVEPCLNNIRRVDLPLRDEQGRFK